MNIRVELRNGDSRQGKYISHNERFMTIYSTGRFRFMTIYSTGRFRLIELIMIADVSEIKTKQFQSCLKVVK